MSVLINLGFHNLKASLSEGSAGRKFRIKNGVSENPLRNYLLDTLKFRVIFI